jgi:hypothetical protein
MMSADSVSNTERRKNARNKLKRVVSTKLSTEDYDKFRVLTSLTYQYRGIKKDSTSEMLRFIITSAVKVLHNQPGFSLL